MNGSFRPSTCLTIQWTKRVEPLFEDLSASQDIKHVSIAAISKPLTVQSTQYCMHSIGEGIVSSFTCIRYAIAHGNISGVSLEIEGFSKDVRVLNVGGTAIKKWEVDEAKIRKFATKMQKQQ